MFTEIFRDNFNINTGDIVIFRDSEDYIEIRKNKQSLADTARKIASKSNQNNKQTPKELKKDYESYLFERGK